MTREHVGRCEDCGADDGEPCCDENDEPRRDHARRAALAKRIDMAVDVARARREEKAAILAGGPCLYERVMKGDIPRLDAWRVRVMAACTFRCEWRRGESVGSAVLARWPFPARLALAVPWELRALLKPIYHVHRRVQEIRDASVAASCGSSVVEGESTQSQNAVMLCVMRDVTVRPKDFALKAVRQRMMREIT